jgi:TP901 family phage tail tape measure protein
MNFISSITLQFRDAFSSGFTSAGQSMAGMKSALGEINKNQDMNRLAADLAMATSLTEPFRQKLSALMDEPSRLAGTFDSSMRNIQSLTGETNESLAQLQTQLLAVGGGAVAGPNAIADAYYNIASGIGRAEVRMDTLRAAVALAESGQADLGAATSGLISVVNAYNTPAENMGDLSDVFFQTVRKGVGSLDGFVSAMSSISGLSASVGIGFDELGSSMAFLTAKGQTESVAATQLKAAMVSLLRPNEELSKALASMGISSGSAMVEQHGLAQSLTMVKAALGGSQDRMAKALGSVEALQAAIVLTADDYTAFAQSYAGGLSGATAAALEAQAQSYESKVARLQAATDSLQIQIGDDINAIKGFFVDMGAGFLNHVAGPIMSSPVGEVFQGIAAGAGLLAQGVLSVGSGALNTASQLVMLTATLQNAGGFAKLFGSALGGILSPLRSIGPSIGAVFKTIGTAVLGAIPAIATFGAALWAALAPILPIVLAVVAGVAVLAVGGYMLVKHWDAVSAFFVNLWNKITGTFLAAFNWIKNLLSGVPGWVLGAAAVFMPFIGIPLLIIKYWDGIKSFFAGLWGNITAAFSAAWKWMANLFISIWENVSAFFVGLWVRLKGLFVAVWEGITGFFAGLWNGIVSIAATAANWFTGVWNAVTGAFAAAWTWASNLFMSIWNGIVGIVTSVANWFGEVWGAAAGTFSAAWTWVADFFTSIWEGIKGVVMGFVEWLSPVIDMIIAPFKAIGNVIGGIINTVGGWFGETVDMGKTEISRMNENKTVRDAAARPVEAAAPITQTAASPVAVPSFSAAPVVPAMEIASPITAPAFTTTSAVSAPSISAGTATAGANTALVEHLAAASMKGIAGMTATTASDAFMDAGASVAPGIDMADFENGTAARFHEAVIPRQTAIETPWAAPEERREKPAPRVFNIQNVNLNADDIDRLLDFARQLEHAVLEPVEAEV